ncbi:MAG TPA: GNAT family protein [Symbiobacteriaceae bacterium]|nr:GNAT family protein [Symbiobacteriaceae bacterium]
MYESERLRLRRVDPVHDLEDRFRWMSDPEVTRYLGMRPALLSRESIRSYLEQCANSADSSVEFAIETKEGKHIGGCTLRGFNHVSRSAEFAIVIGEERGKGYGTEVTKLMIDIAFGYFNLNRFWLTAYEPNVAAIRCYEKAGFVKEGILREHVYMHGQYLNGVMMAVLRSDWERERAR